MSFETSELIVNAWQDVKYMDGVLVKNVDSVHDSSQLFSGNQRL